MRTNAWIATLVAGSLIVLAAAVTYASSSQASRLAQDAGELAQAQQTLSAVATLRSNLGVAVTLVRTSSSDPPNTEDIADAVAATMESADILLTQADSLDAMTIDLTFDRRLEQLGDAFTGFATEVPNESMESHVTAAIQNLDAIEEEIAIFAAAKSSAVESEGERAGDLAGIAGYTVAILVPILLVLGARAVNRRREERGLQEQTMMRRERTAAGTLDVVESLSDRLRRPEVGIHGLARILTGVLDGPERRDERQMLQEVANLILEEANGFDRAIDDVLAHARIAEGSLEVGLDEIDPAAELAPVFEEVEGHRFVAVSFEPGRVVADPGLLRQMIRNLIWDRFERSGPKVNVSGALDGDAYVISVGTFADDGGAPIRSSEDTESSEPRTKAASGPARMGLTVVQELADLLDGSVRYVGREGWSGFDLALPAADNPQVAAPAGDDARSGD